ncbi:MAG: hypothetical protein WCA01_14165 [Burkholderiales bacterium]
MFSRINNLGRLLRDAWCALRGYFGAERWSRAEPIADRDALRGFLESRASYVTQTSLYGYLRTRAGMRYPQLFANDEFVKAIEIAKWQMWFACLSDVSVYAGGLIAQRSGAERCRVTSLLQATIGAILDASEGGRDEAGARRLHARIAQIDWATVADDSSPFSESPRTLIECAPVLEQLKLLDEEIVRNSVRFGWQEVRRELRRQLDAKALMASESSQP